MFLQFYRFQSTKRPFIVNSRIFQNLVNISLRVLEQVCRKQEDNTRTRFESVKGNHLLQSMNDPFTTSSPKNLGTKSNSFVVILNARVIPCV